MGCRKGRCLSMDIAVIVGIIVVVSIVIMLAIGVPIGISIGASSALAILAIIPFAPGMITCAQKIFTGINSFSLLAIPFFVLAGNIMNNGGIALRLVNCAKLISGRLPGSLAQTNVVANMLFGSISGSGTAAAAAIGGTMSKIQIDEGYDKDYVAAVNIASAPSGQIIPPSNVMIVYATVAGSVSVSALFVAGYIPGICWGLSVMLVAGYMAVKRKYFKKHSITVKEGLKVLVDAIPSLLLIIIIIGGILVGVFTATEGSAIAVVYSLFLSFCYRSIKIKDLPGIFLNSCKTTAIVIFMIGVSSILSWVMAYTMIPEAIASGMMSLTSNKYVLLMLMNIILLIVGTFMDPTPAILIFTPIFLPICQSFGMSPVQFGIIAVFNLSIGTITPPVGVILFTGCRVVGITIEEVIKTLLPYFVAIIFILILVTYIPFMTMALPQAMGLIK